MPLTMGRSRRTFRGNIMLEIIGLIALLYMAIKFLPNFLMFMLKLLVGLVIIYLTLYIFAGFIMWQLNF